MKRNLTRLARNYRLALQAHLQPGAPASLVPALGLGLAALEPTGLRAGSNQRAELFFAEAVTPIEKIHPASRQADAHLNRLAKTLGRRTVNLAASQRALRQGIVQRQSAEQAYKKSTGNHARLVTESGRLQKYLRSLTHQILSSQEAERTKISRELHHEVAQTLLGIDVQLLRLKQATTVDSTSLKKEIARTQRIVKNCARMMAQFGSELGK